MDIDGARVGEIECGAVADRDVELAIGSEGQRPARMGDAVKLDVVLLDAVHDHLAMRPGVEPFGGDGARVGGVGEVVTAKAADVGKRLPRTTDQDLFAARDDAGSGRIGGHPNDVGIAVSVGIRRIQADLAGGIRGLGNVERVDVAVGYEIRVEHDVHQAAILDIVDLGAEVGDRICYARRDVHELDHAAFLSDVDEVRIQRRELNLYGRVQAGGEDLLLHVER